MRHPRVKDVWRDKPGISLFPLQARLLIHRETASWWCYLKKKKEREREPNLTQQNRDTHYFWSAYSLADSREPIISLLSSHATPSSPSLTPHSSPSPPIHARTRRIWIYLYNSGTGYERDGYPILILRIERYLHLRSMENYLRTNCEPGVYRNDTEGPATILCKQGVYIQAAMNPSSKRIADNVLQVYPPGLDESYLGVAPLRSHCWMKFIFVQVGLNSRQRFTQGSGLEISFDRD